MTIVSCAKMIIRQVNQLTKTEFIGKRDEDIKTWKANISQWKYGNIE